MNINNTVYSGNLTRSPELRYTQNGTPVANITVANNRRFNQNGEKKEEVCFLECVAFGKTAELIAQYFDKGHEIGVTGRLQQQHWETQEGQKRSKIVLVASSIAFGNNKKGGGAPDGAQQDGDPESYG